MDAFLTIHQTQFLIWLIGRGNARLSQIRLQTTGTTMGNYGDLPT
jgi:hypothetical protein